MCGSLDYACPAPRWDLGQGGKLWNSRNGRSGICHSNDVIGTCICECVRLRPLWVGGQSQCCYGSFLSIIIINVVSLCMLCNLFL